MSLARRAPLRQRDGVRLVHGEADLLPGLFVDRYGAGLSLQTLSEGMDVRKEWVARTLAELTGATHVVCRDDASGRDFEGLTREALGEAVAEAGLAAATPVLRVLLRQILAGR